MKQLLDQFSAYRNVFLYIVLILLGGLFGGFVIAAVLCLPLLFLSDKVFKIEILFTLFIIIFIFGDNFRGPLSFAQNLRFVILGIGLLVLLKFQLFKFNKAKYILPFSIVATVITFGLSPLGFEATIRGLSYFLVALVVFKCVQLLIEHDAHRFFNLLILLLLFYFALNVLVFFVPFLGETYILGRYMGLMANPNGLGLVSMLSYVIIDVARKKNKTSFSRSFFRAFKILLIGLVILSASRTSLFGIFIYEMILRLLKYKFLLGLFFIVTIYVYGISASISTEALVQSFGLSDYLRIETLDDASGRTEVWAVALDEIKNQPWLGKGMLYDNYYINYYGQRYIGEERARAWYGIWNSYLSLLLNVGIIGLLVYAYFWFKMYSLSKMKIIRFAFLVTCLFSAVSESWMAASMNAYTPLVFLCWALQIYDSKPKPIDL